MLRVMRMRVASRPTSTNAFQNNSKMIGFQLLAPSQAACINNKLGYTPSRGFFWGSKKEETKDEIKIEQEVVEEVQANDTISDQVIDISDSASSSQGTIFETIIKDAPQVTPEPSYDHQNAFQAFRWYDETDTANILNAVTPTYTDNIIDGGSTYGFWELLEYLDDIFYNQWIYLAED